MVTLLLPWLFSGLFIQANGAAAETAEGCRTTWNLPSFLEKPRNQADIGWCYAYAAADLASAYQGEVVSAADLAITENGVSIRQSFIPTKKPAVKAPHSQLREGGFSDIALLARIDKGGFCSERDFPSNVATKVTEDPTTKSTKFSKFTLADRLYAALRLGRMNQSPIDCDSSPLAPASLAFPNVPQKELAEILGKMNDLTGDRDRSYRLAYLASLNCENRRTSAVFTEDEVETDRLSVEALDKILASGRLATVGVPTIPILEEPTEADLKKFKNNRKGLERSAGGHMMLLVGQKWNPKSNQCEYIFKNSWGSKSKPEENMVNGYMMIARSKLAEVVTGDLTTITKPPTWKAAALPSYLEESLPPKEP